MQDAVTAQGERVKVRKKKHSDRKRRHFVVALTSSDQYWGELFGDNIFYDLNYSDLFTRMWLNADKAYRKTDLYAFMPKVSQRTAAKYLQQAIDRGLLIEKQDDEDRRSRRITMSSDLRQRIEMYLDYSISAFEPPANG